MYTWADGLGGFSLADFGIPSDATPVASMPGQGSLVGGANGGKGGCNLVSLVTTGKPTTAMPYYSPSTKQYYCGPQSLTSPMEVGFGPPPDYASVTVGPLQEPSTATNPASSNSTGTSTGAALSLSTIPWYVLAAGAGLLLIVIMGDK